MTITIKITITTTITITIIVVWASALRAPTGIKPLGINRKEGKKKPGVNPKESSG